MVILEYIKEHFELERGQKQVFLEEIVTKAKLKEG